MSVDLIMAPNIPTPTNLLFPKATFFIKLVVGEVTLSQDAPLSVDLIMYPLLDATKVLFPYVNPKCDLADIRVTLSKVAPLSVDLIMVKNPGHIFSAINILKVFYK